MSLLSTYMGHTHRDRNRRNLLRGCKGSSVSDVLATVPAATVSSFSVWVDVPTCILSVPVCTPICWWVAFFNSITRRRAWYRIMLYRTTTRRMGKRPRIVVKSTNSGGASTINQHTRPLSVSPRHPMAGRNPIIKPVCTRENVLLHNLDYALSTPADRKPIRVDLNGKCQASLHIYEHWKHSEVLKIWLLFEFNEFNCQEYH